MQIHALDHVGIHVEDVARSLAFYREVLLLEPITRPDMGFPGAWLRLGSVQALHLIGKNSCPDSSPEERHFALTVSDIDAWVERLRGFGLELRGPKRRPDGVMQVFFRDPDGHVIEFSEPQ